jgi:hypothetical protein
MTVVMHQYGRLPELRQRLADDLAIGKQVAAADGDLLAGQAGDSLDGDAPVVRIIIGNHLPSVRCTRQQRPAVYEHRVAALRGEIARRQVAKAAVGADQPAAFRQLLAVHAKANAAVAAGHFQMRAAEDWGHR